MESIKDYVAWILELPETDPVLFRGHQWKEWKLEPRIERFARRQGTLRDAEAELVSDFRLLGAPHALPSTNDWDLLAVAQHHGLMTRLLDWTASPLAALWFAVREPAIPGNDGRVYAFSPQDDDLADRSASPFQVTSTTFFQPSHLSPRIVAQKGWFSVHRYNVAKDHYSTLTRIAKYKNRFFFIDIPEGLFRQLRWELDRLGINEASLFPDLDGLSHHLNWMHSVLDDEKS